MMILLLLFLQDILQFIKNSFDRFRTKFIREDEHESRFISLFTRTLTRQ
jgi:hypothetical protein